MEIIVYYYPVQLCFDVPFPKTFSPLNLKKLVSAFRLKEGGVCFKEVQASKVLVSRLYLAVQSIYSKVPVASTSITRGHAATYWC
jgi:hypothetical protein